MRQARIPEGGNPRRRKVGDPLRLESSLTLLLLLLLLLMLLLLLDLLFALLARYFWCSSCCRRMNPIVLILRCLVVHIGQVPMVSAVSVESAPARSAKQHVHSGPEWPQ